MKPIRRMPWILLAVAATILPAQAPSTDRLESRTAGITVTKPQGWQIIMKQDEAVQGTERLKDQDLLNAAAKPGAIPVFVFTRYPEPHPESLNPSIQVILRPIGELHGKTAIEIMQASVEPLKKAFSDFHFTSEIKAATIGGQPGSSMRATYTLFEQSGKKHPTQTGLYIVPRGALMFLIGTAGPQTGPDVSEKEFDAFLKSIVIRP